MREYVPLLTTKVISVQCSFQLLKLANNDNKIEVGEQVVTSHVSDRFLQGLFVGYVSEVKVDSNNLTRSGYITPAVDFTKLQEVLVITTTKNDLIKQESADTKGE